VPGYSCCWLTIFNAHATRCTQLGEDRARDGGGDNDDGGMLTVVMPAIRNQERKDPGKDHRTYNGVTGYW